MTDTTTTTIDYEQTEYSRDLQISSEGRTMIQDLQDHPHSVFEDTTMKEVYVMAAAYGFNTDQCATQDETGAREIVARKALSDDQVAILEAIAVDHEGTAMVLNDQQLAAEIAQRYALGGLQALLDHFDNADNPREELISEVNAAL
jgi:hypothetical protein